MIRQIPENAGRQFVVDALALLASRPVEIPGHELRRASTVWVDLDSGTGDGDRRELAVTVFPIGSDPDGLEDTWIVAGTGGGSHRYERLDRNGQCRMSGLSAGRWGVLLLAADRSSPKLRSVAAFGSLSKPLPDIATLIRAVSDDNPITCCEALDALRAVAGGDIWPEDDIEPITRQLRDNPEAIVRRAAAELLGEVGGPSAVSPLLRALDDPTWSVQCEAVSSLGLIDDPDTAARLTAIAGDADRDPAVREAAAEALDRLGEVRISVAASTATARDHSIPIPPRPVVSSVPASQVVDAAVAAAQRLATIDPAASVVVEQDGVALLIHPDPAEPTAETVVLAIQPGAGVDGLTAALWAVGPVARVHTGEFDQHGQLVLRGVPRTSHYQLRLHAPDQDFVTQTVAMWAARSTTPVLVRGVSDAPAPQGASLLLVSDQEGRTMTIGRAANGALVVDVVGLGITDRRMIVRLPIRSADGSARLLSPLRWNYKTGQCEAHLTLLDTDRVDDDGQVKALQVSALGSAEADDVVVSVRRAGEETAQAWATLAAEARLHPRIRAAIQSTPGSSRAAAYVDARSAAERQDWPSVAERAEALGLFRAAPLWARYARARRAETSEKWSPAAEVYGVAPSASFQICEQIPIALGIAAIDGDNLDAFVPIIPEGTPYPLPEAMTKTFTAAARRIRIPVHKGVDKLASKNRVQGIVETELPEGLEPNSDVEVSFNYDRDRVITVTVRVPGTTFAETTSLRRKVDALPPAGESSEGLKQAIDVVEDFVFKSAPYIESWKLERINGHLADAKRAYGRPDDTEHWQHVNLLYRDVEAFGLAMILYFADIAADRARRADSVRIRQAAERVRDAHKFGNDARRAQAEQILVELVGRELESESAQPEEDLAAPLATQSGGEVADPHDLLHTKR